jgi:hypothetical protein
MNKIKNLASIIEANGDPKTSILYETLHPYLKSLYVYYKNEFNCEPVLMLTTLYNAAQYAKIVPCYELHEAICDWLNIWDFQDDPKSKYFDAEQFAEYETIQFNSKMLIDLIK